MQLMKILMQSINMHKLWDPKIIKVFFHMKNVSQYLWVTSYFVCKISWGLHMLTQIPTVIIKEIWLARCYKKWDKVFQQHEATFTSTLNASIYSMSWKTHIIARNSCVTLDHLVLQRKKRKNMFTLAKAILF